MVHITGGGISGNLPRIFPDNICAVVRKGSWPVPVIFRLVEEMGHVPEHDMWRTFNMGIGYVIIVPEGQSGDAISILKRSGFDPYIIGNLSKGEKEVRYEHAQASL